MFPGRVNVSGIDIVLVMLAIAIHRHNEDVEKGVYKEQESDKTSFRAISSLGSLVYIQVIFWCTGICN
jgi:hypothetical protein